MGSDLRYALRTLVKNPGFAAVAIVSLALGIGANTAIFTVVDSVLLRMLPVRNPQELYVIASPRDAGRYNTSWNYPDFAAFREHNQSFQGMAAYSGAQPYGFALQDEKSDRPATVAYGLMVSGNYFDVLGVRPAVGRVLNPEDDTKPGAGPYAVLSHGFWQRRFAGDARVIGTVARVNGYPLTIVGVAAKGFKGADVAVAPDFFFPIWMRTEVTRSRNWNNRNNWWLTVLGRMKPGASIAAAETELYTIGKSQEAENRRTAVNQRHVNPAQQVKLLPGAQGYSGARNRLMTPLRVLMIVVGLVLLIACANVANLLLARAAARRREIAVRLAIGAGRWRLVRQLLTESVLLAVAGGIAGIGFSYLAVPVLIDWIPRSGWTPVGIAATPDLRVLGFTVAVSLIAGVVFGLAPALQSARADVVRTLKDDAAAAAGGRRFNLRKGLVVVQVALSLLLLIGAGLFVRSLQNLHDLDAGFRREQLLVVQVDPLRSGYSVVNARSFYERLRERVEGLPGVRSAVLASITPLGGSRWNDVVTVEGYQWKPEERRRATDMNAVGPRFFETVGIPFVAGRDFRPEDSPVETPEPDNPLARRPGEERPLTGPRVVVVNEALVKRFFAGRSPLGARISLGETFRMERSFEIIGVVKDAHYFGLREAKEPMMYQAMWRPGVRSQSLVVRTAKDPESVIESIRREVHALDATIPLLAARTIEQEIDNNILQEKIVATLSSFFGLLALVLASVGLYGVMAQAVARRTREIGIRMALGAQAGSVLWLVLRDALLMVAIGAIVGVPAAFALSRFAGSMLYGITPADPASFALATGVLVAVAAVAGFLPARRATRIDPIAALRYE